MFTTCAKPGCFKAGTNKCSVCLREPYCCGNCQKEDWKFHKLICKALKKLSCQLQPYQEVSRVILETRQERNKKMQLHIRVLVHLICYAEHQFGERIVGQSYRKREGGGSMENWTVEIDVMTPIHFELINLYAEDQSPGLLIQGNLMFPSLQKMLHILKPWSVCLDSLDRNKKSIIVTLLSRIERQVGSFHLHKNEFNLGEMHCQRAITFARQHEGQEEEKCDILYSALRTCYDLQSAQGKYDDALIFAEEAYNVNAIFYNPVHPRVQLAANALIECLTIKGDLGTAETFAQMTLDSLKDPKNGLDQQGEEVALGYHNLANVIHDQKVDFVKAEKLIREALRIRSRLYDKDDLYIGNSSALLAQILQSQRKYGSETKKLLELSLHIDLKQYGPDGVSTAISYANVGTFYRNLSEQLQDTDEVRKNHLSIAQSNFKEAVRIHTKIFGPTHPMSIEFASVLVAITRKLSVA